MAICSSDIRQWVTCPHSDLRRVKCDVCSSLCRMFSNATLLSIMSWWIKVEVRMYVIYEQSFLRLPLWVELQKKQIDGNLSDKEMSMFLRGVIKISLTVKNTRLGHCTLYSYTQSSASDSRHSSWNVCSVHVVKMRYSQFLLVVPWGKRILQLNHVRA
jgi:hypothetical protein